MKAVKVSECLKKRKAFVKFIYLNKIRKKNQDLNMIKNEEIKVNECKVEWDKMLMSIAISNDMHNKNKKN